MSIGWLIFIYLVIGIIVSLASDIFFDHFDTSDHVLCMYLWPIMVAIIIFVQIPAKLFDSGIKALRKRKLKKSCEKCARNSQDRCPRHLRPWARSCYKHPLEVKTNETQKTN